VPSPFRAGWTWALDLALLLAYTSTLCAILRAGQQADICARRVTTHHKTRARP
jgi:hypothetical protein